MDNLLAGKWPSLSLKGSLTGLMSSDFRYRSCSGLMSNTIPGSTPKTVRLQPGIAVRLPAGMLFGFSPERRSPSPRNRVRLGPEFAHEAIVPPIEEVRAAGASFPVIPAGVPQHHQATVGPHIDLHIAQIVHRNRKRGGLIGQRWAVNRSRLSAHNGHHDAM